MKKTAYALAAFAALTASSAFAADLPSRKGPPVLPPPPAPPPLWTGFYVGLNAGGAFGGSNTTTLSAFDTRPLVAANFGVLAGQISGAYPVAAPSSNSGFIGGGQIGYNWQFNPSIVLGVEADIQGTTLGSTGVASAASANYLGVAVPPYAGFASVSSRLDYLGTVRGRIGWLATPTLLLYGTGGFAYGGVNLSYAGLLTNPVAPIAISGASSFADTRTGWTAGGGAEWMFMPNWSAKVEYLYYDLGTATTSFFGCLPTPPAVAGNCSVASASRRFDGHIVRAGLNYHFNWGSAPVVAKY